MMTATAIFIVSALQKTHGLALCWVASLQLVPSDNYTRSPGLALYL